MRLWQSALLLYLFVPPWSGFPRAREADPRVGFTIEPVALFPQTPRRKNLGSLTFLRGYRLVSSDAGFGGYSSLATDGKRFTLLSDGGQGIGFTLSRAGKLSAAHAFRLPDGPGTGWEKRDRDSESMAVDPATGQRWVAFENSNQIWRYAPGFARAERHAAPPAMASWPDNRGTESMMRLRDGRFVLINEDEPWTGSTGSAGVVFAGDPTAPKQAAIRFSYRSPAGFAPTDIAELPDGRWIIVNRRFSARTGFTACVTIANPARLRAGAVLTGREIARFEAPAQHDNFEGIAVVRHGNATHIWLISDDNSLRPWQQSLLLEFRLDEVKTRPHRVAGPQAAG